jgi:hypothetical protein
MCVVSMVMDHYWEKWQPFTRNPDPQEIPGGPQKTIYPEPQAITADKINEFRRLLARAREYDRKHNEPECELEEKKAKIRDLAQSLGIDVSFIDEKDSSL